MKEKFFVYMIKGSDDYLYTGITRNLQKRYHQHQTGQDRNTKNRLPIKIVYIEEFGLRVDAAKREKEIKGWRREKKEDLIRIYAERSSLH